MKGLIRGIYIPISALVDDSITPGTKLLLWVIAHLCEENNEWVVDADYIQNTLGIETNNLSHKLGDLEKSGFIKKRTEYLNQTSRRTIVSLTKKFQSLTHWENGSELKKLNHSNSENPLLNNGNESELKKLNHSDEDDSLLNNNEDLSELKKLKHSLEEKDESPLEKLEKIAKNEKEVIEEKTIVNRDTIDNSPNNNDFLENEIKINSQTFHKKKEKAVTGRLFTTMYSDKKDLNNQKKAVIAQMFTYAEMQFNENQISTPISNLFKTFLREMLLCRRVTGEDAKAMVAQIIKFKKVLGYEDDEVIECLQESLMRRWMYIKPIDNLAEYRMKKAAAEDRELYNNSEHPSGRKVKF